MEDWQVAHREVILKTLQALQFSSLRYILKGGTALMLSHGLNRFSEDVDLDQPQGAFDFMDVMNFVGAQNSWDVREAKNTKTVKRVFMHYGGNKPLKVEVSMRETDIPESFYYRDSAGFYVYGIQAMTRFKCTAYSDRDKIRDAYDLCFLVCKYLDQMDDVLKHMVRQALLGKKFDNLDYLMHNQPDDLVPLAGLEDLYLEAWDKLGLLRED